MPNINMNLKYPQIITDRASIIHQIYIIYKPKRVPTRVEKSLGNGVPPPRYTTISARGESVGI